MEDPTLKDPDTLITDKADSTTDTVGMMGQEVIVWPAWRDCAAVAVFWRLVAGDMNIELLNGAELQLWIKSLDLILKNLLSFYWIVLKSLVLL